MDGDTALEVIGVVQVAEGGSSDSTNPSLKAKHALRGRRHLAAPVAADVALSAARRDREHEGDLVVRDQVQHLAVEVYLHPGGLDSAWKFDRAF